MIACNIDILNFKSDNSSCSFSRMGCSNSIPVEENNQPEFELILPDAKKQDDENQSEESTSLQLSANKDLTVQSKNSSEGESDEKKASHLELEPQSNETPALVHAEETSATPAVEKVKVNTTHQHTAQDHVGDNNLQSVDESHSVIPIASIVVDPLSVSADPTPPNPAEPPTPKIGWLMKQGHQQKNWKRRHFVLESGYLRYFADSSPKPPYGKDLKGTYCLIGFTVEPVLAVFDREIDANPNAINAIRAKYQASAYGNAQAR